MTRQTPLRCQEKKANGAGCMAYALAGSAFCFFHDPAKGAERTAARQAGGRKHRAVVLPPETPDQPLATVADVVTLLAATINQVRRGALDPKVANTVGYLAALLLKALEESDLAARVAALEAAVHRPLPGAPSLFELDAEETEAEAAGAAPGPPPSP